jgi:hypothetical protein
MKRSVVVMTVILLLAGGNALAEGMVNAGPASGHAVVGQYPQCPPGTAWRCRCVPVGREFKTFRNPRYQGFRLDWCWTWAKHCGHKTANEFCRRQGYRRAVNWKAPVIEISPTKMMGSGQLCTIGRCGSFEWITCAK